MANIKSAKKRIRVIETKTARNKRVKAHLKSILKSFETAIENEDKEAARTSLAKAEKKLMQAVAKGTLHKNTASRKVSRLTKRFITTFGVEALTEGTKESKPKKSSTKKASTKKASTAKKANEPKEEPEAEEQKEEPKEDVADEKDEKAEEAKDDKKED